ncbi:MAG: transcriptional regulator [Deltaproteobacteria bacterium]|nr:MAG: transcriptional regulator [Deltaproteobacteria bacterium]
MPVKGAMYTSLGNALFTTTQQRVLGYLFGQPTRSFFANELIGLTGSGSGAVQRELKRLVESGLATVRQVGNQKHYQANPDAPIFTELSGIVQKTFGLAMPLREALTPLDDQIQAAFVYGSVAKKTDTASSDIDILILSDSLSYADVMGTLAGLEGQFGRQINPTLYSSKELAKRLQEGNAFVTRILDQPKIWLKGNENDLPA